MIQIHLRPATQNDQSYDILYRSATVHTISGKINNRHFNHLFTVWCNQPDGKLGTFIDPHGKPTTDQITVTADAQASVISSTPDPNKTPGGEQLTVGDEIEFILPSGNILGVFQLQLPRASREVVVARV
jgi:hypothetical protein